MAAILICGLGGIAAALNHEAVLNVVSATQEGGADVLTVTVVLFLWYFASQLVIAPSGTITLIMGGVVLGPLAGVLYFVAMLMAGAILHTLARPGYREVERLVRRLVKGRSLRSFTYAMMRQSRRSPISTTAALRLLPIVPSAGCALLAAAAGSDLRGFILGTVATGWIRPLAFAAFAEEVRRSLQAPSFQPEALIFNPVLLITVFFLVTPFIILFAATRRTR